jgi:hypothetical protein
MKILILGTGKTGTTVMLYKVAGGLPNCHAFSGGQPGEHIGNYENAVYKHTYEERKNKNFQLFHQHMEKENYDRKIWIARDPRDTAVSRMLYRWHKWHRRTKKQYETHLALVLKKEKDPASIPFFELCRYTGHNGSPRSVADVEAEERVRYDRMYNFVKELGDDWFLFTYEDMISENFTALNDYLGFEVKADGQVPQTTVKSKVLRKKATGDWRLWFTAQDVELFKPVFKNYMKLIGYDWNDWSLSENPVIEPEYSSVYIQNLMHKATKNKIKRYLDSVVQRFQEKRSFVSIGLAK